LKISCCSTFSSSDFITYVIATSTQNWQPRGNIVNILTAHNLTFQNIYVKLLTANPFDGIQFTKTDDEALIKKSYDNF